MKAGISILLISAATAGLLLPVLNHRRSLNPSIAIDPSAKAYWIEYDERLGGTVGSSFGACLPLSDYEGQGGHLWLMRPAGLAASFVLFEYNIGSNCERRLVWHAPTEDRLIQVADIELFADKTTDPAFEDVDHDGREDLLETWRDHVRDGFTGRWDSWAVRHQYHRWTGTVFTPAWSRLHAFGQIGPLVPLASAK